MATATEETQVANDTGARGVGEPVLQRVQTGVHRR